MFQSLIVVDAERVQPPKVEAQQQPYDYIERKQLPHQRAHSWGALSATYCLILSISWRVGSM